MNFLRSTLSVPILCFLFSTLLAQSPRQVSSNFAAYSPSIVAIPNTHKQVSAYTVENTTTGQRSIQIDVSTDDGATWRHSDHTFPTAPSSIGGVNACLDEPEISPISNGATGGSSVIVMCRGWDPNSSYVEGATAYSYHGGAGTIFWHSGIYYTTSLNPFSLSTDSHFTDGDWGYFDLSETFNSGFNTLQEITSHPSGDASLFATLDHPRLAFRPDYTRNTQAYTHCGMVWEKRVYKKSSGGTFSGADITSSIQFAVVSGIEAGGASIPKYGILLPQGSSTGPTFVSKTFGTNPLRADIAAAPDTTFWLSYYEVNDYSTSRTSYYLNRVSVVVSGLVATVVFAKSPHNVNPGQNIYLPGVYDNTRGYFYSEEYKLSVPDPGAPHDRSRDHKLDGSGMDGYEFNIDLAQGPSIEVVTTNFNDCSPTYRVGLVYTETKESNVSSNARRVRPLRFWCWEAASDPTLANSATSSWSSELLSQLNPSALLFDNVSFEVDRGDCVDTTIAEYVQAYASSGSMNTMGLFPRLRHTVAKDVHYRDASRCSYKL